ncbi:hypothetical protein C8F01DRAFT_701642 [Mycena amicta]|nr:hypothetical protein C8F01DRAFT_701642 [Mycena amicta]
MGVRFLLGALALLLSFVPTTTSSKKCQPSLCHSNEAMAQDFLCGDPRLGPKHLPTKGHWNSLLEGYTRFGADPAGNHTERCPDADAFLKKWFDDSSWEYRRPAADGLQLSTAHKPISGETVLTKGARVDSFETNSLMTLWPAGMPFRMRALPPSSLDTPASTDGGAMHNYRVYEVVYPFVVRAGLAAAFYGQPGQGTVYQTRTSIDLLIQGGFLRRMNANGTKNAHEDGS